MQVRTLSWAPIFAGSTIFNEDNMSGIYESHIVLIDHIAQSIQSDIKMITDFLMDKDVILKVGKYKNRLGKIRGVLPSKSHGLLFLVMVMDITGTRFLNSNIETRSYRRLDNFYFA